MFRITAANLPEHARNLIHTDAGARAAGFERALVAGVTTYAYLTHPLVEALGMPWLESGGGEVRFRRPVFDGDDLSCVPAAQADGTDVVVDAIVSGDEQPRATVRAVLVAGPVPDMRPGEPLRRRSVVLDGEYGSGYGSRAGDGWSFYADHGVTHPAVWPALANLVVGADVARGPWIHTRSIIRHHGVARAGATALIDAVVVRRFESHGERAVLDVRITVDGQIVATLEHEAIVALAEEPRS